MAKYPWLRFYTDALENFKVQSLPGDLFKFWVNILCVARKAEDGDGALPPAVALSFTLRLPLDCVEERLAALVAADLLDTTATGAYIPHNWRKHQYKSDSSTERVRKHRSTSGDETFQERSSNVSGNVPSPVSVTFPDSPGNVSETVQIQIQRKKEDTEQEQEQEAETRAQPPARRERVPASVTVRLRADYERFIAAYPPIRIGDGSGNWFAWQEQHKAGLLDPIEKIMAGLEAHKASADWQEQRGRFVPRAIRFINERIWTIPPRKDDPPKARGGSSGGGPGGMPDIPKPGRAVY